MPQNHIGSSLFSALVTGVVSVPLVCLEAEISDHFFGVTPSRITGKAGCRLSSK